MKRIMGWFLCFAFAFSVCSGICMSASAAGEPYVTDSLPTTMKLGDSLKDLDDPIVHYHNLVPDRTVLLAEFDYEVLNRIAMGDHCGDGPQLETVDKQGNVDSREIDAFFNVFYRPGTLIYQPKYYYTDDEYASFDNATPVGNPIRITIEEPLITHNAPKTIKIGSSFTLNTALTNIGISNRKVSEYTEAIEHDKDPYYMMSVPDQCHVLAYRPIVEVVEGKHLSSKVNKTTPTRYIQVKRFLLAGQVR